MHSWLSFVCIFPGQSSPILDPKQRTSAHCLCARLFFLKDRWIRCGICMNRKEKCSARYQERGEAGMKDAELTDRGQAGVVGAPSAVGGGQKKGARKGGWFRLRDVVLVRVPSSFLYSVKCSSSKKKTPHSVAETSLGLSCLVKSTLRPLASPSDAIRHRLVLVWEGGGELRLGGGPLRSRWRLFTRAIWQRAGLDARPPPQRL